MQQKERFIQHARGMIGTPWRHRGRKPWAVDCVGLIVLSLQAADFEVNDRTDYGREPWKAGLDAGLRAHFGEPLSGGLDKAELGDVALIQFDGYPAPSHVAIIGELNGGLTLLHAYSRVAVCEHLINEQWAGMIKEVFRPWHK